MKLLVLVILLNSCNVVKTLTSGETDVGDGFFDGNHGGSNHCTYQNSSEYHCCTESEKNDSLSPCFTNLNSSLVSFWRLDEDGISSRVDHAGNNTLVPAGAGLVSANINGRTALDCRASNSSDNIGSAATTGLDFGTNGDFAISFWVYKLSSGAVEMYILRTNELYLRLPNWDNSQVQTYLDAGNSQTSQLVNLNLNSWEHVVVNVSRLGGYTYYLNGQHFNHDSSNSTSANLSSGASFFLCMDNAFSSVLDGYIDDVGIWSRTLTEGEIYALSAGETPQ